MSWFSKKTENQEPKDESQKHYREVFQVKDKFLINYATEMVDGKEQGYIVFIDYENDLDYVENRARTGWTDDDNEKFTSYVTKLQKAEAAPALSLTEKQIITFKRKLGAGYVLALQRNWNEIDKVIRESLSYLQHRNTESARRKFLEAGGVIALVFAIIGLLMYVNGSENKWYYGIVFGVLGAYTSIWSRYGKLVFTGLASSWLHYLEAASRLFVGVIFAVVAMFAIKCGLLFSQIGEEIAIFAYSLASFAASFSERFIPSLIEKFINESLKDNEQTIDNDIE